MPNIVRARGVHLTDDVLRIKDPFPTKTREENKLYIEEMDGEHGRVVIMDVFDMVAAKPETEAEAEAYTDEEEPQGEAELQSPLAEEMLEQAMREAEEIRRLALEEAQAEKDRILSEAMAEAEALKQEALAQGHRDGYEEAAATIRQSTDELEVAIARLEGQLAGFEADYEDQLKWMALEIASRVLGIKVKNNDGILTTMVDRVVQGLKNEHWIRVEVAQEMTKLIGSLSDLYHGREDVDVSPIPADEGTILVETSSGVVDASLKTQLDNLRIYFQNNAG